MKTTEITQLRRTGRPPTWSRDCHSSGRDFFTSSVTRRLSSWGVVHRRCISRRVHSSSPSRLHDVGGDHLWIQNMSTRGVRESYDHSPSSGHTPTRGVPTGMDSTATGTASRGSEHTPTFRVGLRRNGLSAPFSVTV